MNKRQMVTSIWQNGYIFDCTLTQMTLCGIDKLVTLSNRMLSVISAHPTLKNGFLFVQNKIKTCVPGLLQLQSSRNPKHN
jgi:hypothetical protein